jgi:hypothetical protein
VLSNAKFNARKKKKQTSDPHETKAGDPCRELLVDVNNEHRTSTATKGGASLTSKKVKT